MTEEQIIQLIQRTLIDPYPTGEKDTRPMKKQEWGRLQSAMRYSGVPRSWTRLHAAHSRHLGEVLIRKIRESQDTPSA